LNQEFELLLDENVEDRKYLAGKIMSLLSIIWNFDSLMLPKNTPVSQNFRPRFSKKCLRCSSEPS
jgi:hypothetical protein